MNSYPGFSLSLCMNNKIILESLASDLKRVALGIHRGSFSMAERFSDEALKRKQEVNMQLNAGYITRLLNQLETLLSSSDSMQKAENALMYSTLLQNYAQKLA